MLNSQSKLSRTAFFVLLFSPLRSRLVYCCYCINGIKWKYQNVSIHSKNLWCFMRILFLLGVYMCTRLWCKMFVPWDIVQEFENRFSRMIRVYFWHKRDKKFFLLCFRCEFLIHMKGQEFVGEIQARYPHLLEQVNMFL